MKRFVIGLTGASGAPLFKALLEQLKATGQEVYLVASKHGKEVFEHETGLDFKGYINHLNYSYLHECDNDDMFNKIASGSFHTDGMIILPCSMSTVSKIASGAADTLLLRAADVHIKERRKVLAAFREAPLSAIHLQNLATLSQNQVIVFPTVLSFYSKPKTLDQAVIEMTSRILSYFDIHTNTKFEWLGK